METLKPRIPFNIAHLTGREDTYLAESMSSRFLTGDGPFTARASELISGLVGGARLPDDALLHGRARDGGAAVRPAPGDEVIMPSYTFVSTANAFVRAGARPVFVDIRPDTLNLDEALVEAAITPRTKVIAPVHYAGVACEMDPLMQVAKKHGLLVVEDSAQGVHAYYKDRALGSIGDLSAYSFHDTKNYVCGEGGALTINNPARLVERAEIIRDKGTNRQKFFRGEIDKYRWVDAGSSYLPSDLLAAFLTAQLEGFDDIQKRRQWVWSRYDTELASWAAANRVSTPTVPADCEQPAHLYFLLLPHPDDQQALLAHLDADGILGTFHYVPLDSSPFGSTHGRTAGCPVTADVSNRLVRLPLYADMGDEEISRVIDSVTSFVPTDAS